MKERRIWYFRCVCGRKASSHKKTNAVNEKCRVCRTKKISDNQIGLFGDDDDNNPTNEFIGMARGRYAI